MTPRLLACLTGALLASAPPLAACDIAGSGTVTSPPPVRSSATQSPPDEPAPASASGSADAPASRSAPTRA
ncbi:MAG: transcriptional regulator, partial [Carbonactinosporaceae bacterium]